MKSEQSRGGEEKGMVCSLFLAPTPSSSISLVVQLSVFRWLFSEKSIQNILKNPLLHRLQTMIFSFQVRDEYRVDYDPGRGGYGKKAQQTSPGVISSPPVAYSKR